ncbi:MAG TPA: DNA polymerase Y family protein, partial [Ferruginibacter sp.]|nr:DNA polymerase Y family protein [Ferruginibacter sp.]
MQKRFVSIWFRYLKTDWFIRRQPSLQHIPFVLVTPDHGRMIVTAANNLAEKEGVFAGMVLADASAIIPELQSFDDEPDRAEKLLTAIGEWLIRFTPLAAVDLPDGIILDISDCAHLWGGEKQYLSDIFKRLKNFGYHVQLAIADTIGTAWAVARYDRDSLIIEPGQQMTALLSLPAAALRIDKEIVERLEKLGLRQIGQFINMPRTALRRRFGQDILMRLDQSLGYADEMLQPVIPIEPFQERLHCFDPIVTATGIEIALNRLLDGLCGNLMKEEKGLRMATLKCFRVDGKVEQISIGTNHPTHNNKHLFKLFELKIETIEPALGIELFILEALKVEALSPLQERLWNDARGLDDTGLCELLDRIAGKLGSDHIQRFVPDEHYWPERSFKQAGSITESPAASWKLARPRPLQILSTPEAIEVTAPIPDYPPMNF